MGVEVLNPMRYVRAVADAVARSRLRRQPNMRGATFYPAGSSYSPLLDINGLDGPGNCLQYDGPEWWQHVDLRVDQQRAYYRELLTRFPPLPFPADATRQSRYWTKNEFFVASDAFTLSGVMRRETPRLIIEIGAGFSSAVMLDTLDSIRASTELIFVEPFPQRLEELLTSRDRLRTEIRRHVVQETPVTVFDRLEAQDILFIDSSHVAKVGSDLAFLLLRVLPRLKPGVLVHFHDIFYPFSYSASWIREGRAWNESLFLRAFLVQNRWFEVFAFNSFAGTAFPEIFQKTFPMFLENTGGSIWLKKVA